MYIHRITCYVKYIIGSVILIVTFSVVEHASAQKYSREVECSQTNVFRYAPSIGKINIFTVEKQRKYIMEFSWSKAQFPLWFSEEKEHALELEVIFYNYFLAGYYPSSCINPKATIAYAKGVEWALGPPELNWYIDDPFTDNYKEPSATIGYQDLWNAKPNKKYKTTVFLKVGIGNSAKSHVKVVAQRGRMNYEHIYCEKRGNGENPAQCVFPCAIDENEFENAKIISFCDMIAPGCKRWLITKNEYGIYTPLGSCDPDTDNNQDDIGKEIICPDDKNCSEQECGKDPICDLDCGVCGEGQICDAGDCICDNNYPVDCEDYCCKDGFSCSGEGCAEDGICLNKSSSYKCDNVPVEERYRCSYSECGGAIEISKLYRYCDGITSQCKDNNLVWSDYETEKQCSNRQKCKELDETCICEESDDCSQECGDNFCQSHKYDSGIFCEGDDLIECRYESPCYVETRKSCSEGQTCKNGECQCDASHPVNCEDFCCEAGLICGSDKCLVPECTTGICCDGGNYRPSSYPCESNLNENFLCYDGTDCGQDIYISYLDQYCSGYSVNCDGEIKWDNPEKYIECGNEEVCIEGKSECIWSASCAPPPTLISPSDEASFTDGSSVIFTWKELSNAKRYKIKICDDQDMTSCISERPFELADGEISYEVENLDYGNWYWQVAAIGYEESLGWGRWSLQRSFEINPNCSSNFCQNNNYSSGSYCDSNQIVSCDFDGMCNYETNRIDCGYGEVCSYGECVCGSNYPIDCVNFCCSEGQSCGTNYCEDYECTSGDCCDGQNYLPSSYKCSSTPTDQNYRCVDSSCGGNIEVQKQYKYCNGYSENCGTDNLKWSDWEYYDSCASSEKCDLFVLNMCHPDSACGSLIVTASPSIAKRNYTISLKGSEFTSNSTAKVYVDGAFVANVSVNSSGDFSYSYYISSGMSYGYHDYYAKDSSDAQSNTTRFYVVAPQVQAVPSIVYRENTINQDGFGFTPGGNADLEFTYPDDHVETIPNDRPIDANGNLYHSYFVPLNAATGYYYYRARDGGTDIWSDQVQFEVR